MSTNNNGRVGALLDKVADTKFARDVLGPKVIKPVADWYETAVEGDPDAAPADVVIEPRDRRAAITPGAGGGSDDTVDLREADAAVRQKVDAGMGERSATPKAGTTTAPAEQLTTGATGKKAAKKAAKKAKKAPKPPTRLQKIQATLDRVKVGIKKHNLVVVAAGIAFWGLLAIPAVLTAALSIYGMVADPDEVESQIEDNLDSAPEEVQTIIAEQLEGVAGASGGSLAVGAVVGILLALWTSSGAMAKLLATFNTIWNVDETRKFVQLRGTALLLTFGGILFIGAAAFLLALLPAILDAAGMGDLGRWVLNITRFPTLLLVMALGLAVLYWLGPNRKRRYKPLTVGAVVGTVLWVLVSGLFTIYTSSFATYNETYGTLGALVVLLLWLFVTAFMVLIGAEIDAAAEGVVDPEVEAELR